MERLTDQFGRSLHYLRISLTDRCNFRCVYCMPPEGISLLPRAEVLRIDEFERLARIFVSLGINKIRLTGGEPLLRHKIVALVAALSHIDGLNELGLTTNGSLLAPLAQPLKEAGLASVNVSLDSLDPERFSRITLRDEFPVVLEGIGQALKAGLKVKINVVVLDSLTKEEVIAFCRMTREKPVEVRFLEFMPLCGTGWKLEQTKPIALIREWIREEFDLHPLPRNGQVAETYTLNSGLGRIGFIASMTEPFCDSCTRLRLTSTGGFHPCLFSLMETDLRTPMRKGSPDEEIARLIRETAWLKPKGHGEFLEKNKYEELPKIRSLGG
ncbi:MAG: GTP 3',8-cyclase MoaA [Deltaproteobacteria bacterium]|nr:GTP 3',8-cyclase MoaA [Deltaproteobacteria bacterium]